MSTCTIRDAKILQNAHLAFVYSFNKIFVLWSKKVIYDKINKISIKQLFKLNNVYRRKK